jgi:hypothetical protein
MSRISLNASWYGSGDIYTSAISERVML